MNTQTMFMLLFSALLGTCLSVLPHCKLCEQNNHNNHHGKEHKHGNKSGRGVSREKEAVQFKNLMGKTIKVVPVRNNGVEHGTFKVEPDHSVLIPIRAGMKFSHFIIDGERFNDCYVNGMSSKKTIKDVSTTSFAFGEHDEHPPHLMCVDDSSKS